MPVLSKITSKLTYANVVATLALFVALGGGAYALNGIPGSGGVFHGCVSNSTGQLRVVKSGASCHKRTRRAGSGESAITWDQQGVRGPSGAAGPQGVPGARGAQGVPGASATALWAVVAGNFEVNGGPLTILAASDPSISAEGSGVGAFVDFPRNIEGCAIEATVGTNGPITEGNATAAAREAHPTQVRVDYRHGSPGHYPALDVAVFC